MKKLLTLFTLLLTVCSGAWGKTITWNTADNSTSSDVTIADGKDATFTGDDGNTVLTYTYSKGCKRLKNNGGLAMNGVSQYNNSNNQRYFTFKAPSATGTVSITFAGINGKTDGTGSADVRIYGGTTVAFNVSTLNSSLTSPIIAGLQTGTSDIIITFSAKCTIKEIKWTDVAAPTYETIYANNFSNTPMGDASVSYTNMAVVSSNITGWLGWASSFDGGVVSSSSACKATLTFTTPLVLVSNGEDRGRIRIYWGHSTNNKTLGLKVNGSSVSFSPTTVANTLYPKVLNIAEYTIPDNVEKISSIEPSGSSSSGTYFFRIEVLTYASTPAAAHTVTYQPGEGSGEDVVDDEATTISGCPNTFTAPLGKGFVGWKDGEGTDYAVGDEVTSDLTLIAQWDNVYTVTFNLQGHGDAIDAQNIINGGKVTEPTAPTASGYDFNGWYKEAECTNAWNFDTDVVTETKTLFAKWTEHVAPTAGVIFSANAKAADKSFDKESTTEITSTNADISGGKMYAINGQNSSKTLIEANSGSFVLTNNNTIFKVVLDDPLKAGDVITCLAKGGKKDNSYDALGLWISTSEDRPGSAPACSGSDATTTMHQMIDYTVEAEDEYVNATTLYIHRAFGGTTYFDEFTITRNNSITLNNVDGAANGFSTFCSPNNFTVSGATAYKASIADNKLTLTEVTGVIPANEGVILAGTTGATATIAYTNSTATADMKDNDLKGTTARVLTSTLKGEYDHFLAFQKTTNTFKEYNGTNFPANKAYVVTNDAPSREFEMIFSDQDNNEQGTETDGIAGVEAEKNANVAYNLAGQKVGKDYKGIVIVNGKKYVRK